VPYYFASDNQHIRPIYSKSGNLALALLKGLALCLTTKKKIKETRMKLKNVILSGAALSCLCLAQASFAFTAVTDTATDTNTKTPPNSDPGAQVGDTFSVTMGSFASYTPGAGDPTITGGDLNLYRFSLNGAVTSVNSGVVSYAGFYQIFYDADQNGIFDAGDFNYSSGNLLLSVDFTTGGPYAANGTLTQTAGPSLGFPSTGFAEPDATFTGTYAQGQTAAIGYVQGTIQSAAPDMASTFGLLGVSAAGLLAAKRRMVKA
jgi:hypothetical protein